ncbi:hypothetical protein KFE25_011631 [Diacronema lutheri]|uniref:C2H2-type domain-containing protein n=1 Tax=Diacronema lutheri TaxID=2081491 RepID=A0A8J5XB44_DIALT|nr:hypothetical protein KFE25_011631 [Diacronema lutheri]
MAAEERHTCEPLASSAAQVRSGGWVPKYTSNEIDCTECICGYSCGTAAALHRHLDKHPNRTEHAAKAAGSRGKQWVANGSVKQRSELFEERIRSISQGGSSGHISTDGAAADGSPGSQPLSPSKARARSGL